MRQGCPLSPLLFICAIEPLLQLIRKDKLVRGPMILGSGGQHIKALGYMDDICVLCEVRRVKLLINCFCIASAFKVNWDKSKTKTFFQPHVPDSEMESVEGGIRVLGIHFD